MTLKFYKLMFVLSILWIEVAYANEWNKLNEISACKVSRCKKEARRKFRTIDGRCNNLNHPKWGKSYTCYPRFVDANYPDGYGNTIANPVLLNPRVISNSLFKEDVPHKSKKYNLMLMNWGQILANEMTYTNGNLTPLYNRFKEPCCDNKNTSENPQCAPILISEDDFLNKDFGFTCMDFIRSYACPTCKNESRKLINIRTSFIDMGSIYGHKEKRAKQLRAHKKGLLKMQDKGRFLVDLGIHENSNCAIKWELYYPKVKGIECFISGDDYVNNNPWKISMNTIFAREHNRLALLYHRAFPQLKDEQLFQRARRILIAKMQMITYNEFLPPFFGQKLMEEFNLSVLKSGYTDYDGTINPSTTIEISTAGLRAIGHSMVSGDTTRRLPDGTVIKDPLADRWHYTVNLTKGLLDEYIRGFLFDHANKIDIYYEDVIRNYFDRNFNKIPPNGVDLISIDIQRGRDHGLPTYAQVYKKCYNKEIRSFDDLNEILKQENIEKLKAIYRTAEEIELYPGIAAEIHAEDALLGPVAICLWRYHFYNVKFGDRFYFEHRNQKGSLSECELISNLLLV
ncbi:Peroxidasin-like protein [Dinothrombium tinctorium]|uniref:Peroxidasin-like protein n=1 Tax=Dinothrombium tinctorium TaxID=1965070 RepID=A0A443RIY9_9ACAR|nr:Peroxidasin-like protein [Dinothrombium tinctorium]